MADFRGIEDFVAAIAGGGNIQAAEHDAVTRRLIQQRSAQGLLDKRIEEAATAKDVNRNRSDVNAQITDPVLRALTLSNTGSSFNSAQSGLQTGIENRSMEAALNAIIGSVENEQELPTDILNALNAVAGQKLLAPTNVRVNDQAGADILKTEADTGLADTRAAEINALLGGKQDLLSAQTGAANANILKTEADKGLADTRAAEIIALLGGRQDLLSAQTEAANAQADERRRPDAGSVNSLESPGTFDASLLFQNPETVPVTTDKNFFSPDVVENLPFNDPRTQKALEKMTQDERDALVQDLGPEFAIWRVSNMTTDPSLKDASVAIGKFLASKQGASVAGASAAPASATAPIQYVVGPDGNLVLKQ